MEDASLLEARRRAEQAVSGMAEGPLKVEAFRVILESLIYGDRRAAATSSLPLEGRSTGKSRRRTGGATRSEGTERAPRSSVERILSIRDDGFFGTGRTLGQIRDELASRGWPYPITSLSGSVQTLVQRRELRRMMVKDGKKETYHYVNP